MDLLKLIIKIVFSKKVIEDKFVYKMEYNRLRTPMHFIGADGQIYKCTVEFDKEANHIDRLENTGKMVLDKDKLAFWTMKTPFRCCIKSIASSELGKFSLLGV